MKLDNKSNGTLAVDDDKQIKAHKCGSNMCDFKQIILWEIDFIMQEQRNLIQYNNQLEDRRLRLLEFVQSGQEISMSKSARESIVKDVSKLELKLNHAFEEKSNEKYHKTCRYNNRGFCKFGSDCKFYHSRIICDVFQKEGKCFQSNCMLRHPKACKYWLNDANACFRDNQCKYMHVNGDKGKGIKHVKEKSKFDDEKEDIEDTGKEDTDEAMEETETETSKQNIVDEKHSNADLKITEFTKDVVMKEMEKENAKLKDENVGITKELEKLKRILPRMAQEIEKMKNK